MANTQIAPPNEYASIGTHGFNKPTFPNNANQVFITKNGGNEKEATTPMRNILRFQPLAPTRNKEVPQPIPTAKKATNIAKTKLSINNHQLI